MAPFLFCLSHSLSLLPRRREKKGAEESGSWQGVARLEGAVHVDEEGVEDGIQHALLANYVRHLQAGGAGGCHNSARRFRAC